MHNAVKSMVTYPGKFLYYVNHQPLKLCRSVDPLHFSWVIICPYGGAAFRSFAGTGLDSIAETINLINNVFSSIMYDDYIHKLQTKTSLLKVQKHIYDGNSPFNLLTMYPYIINVYKYDNINNYFVHIRQTPISECRQISRLFYSANIAMLLLHPVVSDWLRRVHLNSWILTRAFRWVFTVQRKCWWINLVWGFIEQSVWRILR